MAYKTYTVTENGSSNGNVIAQPFTIEVHEMKYVDRDGESLLGIVSCTKNGSGTICQNDDIPSYKEYPLPTISSGKGTDLTNTIEVDLTAAYGVNWS